MQVKSLTKDQELLADVMFSGLTKKREEVKTLLVEASEKEDKGLIELYLKELNQIDNLLEKLDDAHYEHVSGPAECLSLAKE